MSLLGIDIGTTGCKTAVISTDGRILVSAYEEYDVLSPRPGWAELEAASVWNKLKTLIRKVVSQAADDPVTSLSASSFGEAMVPVSRNRRVLGPSILNFDVRGEEYLERLRAGLGDETLFRINGNTPGNHYSLTKLMWIKEHQPDLYERAWKFLHWSSFVEFMLGAEPVLDYSLANRTLLFDLDRKDWSAELIDRAGLDRGKLPELAPSGKVVGTVSKGIAEELGFSPRVTIVTGAHDQCANAVGSGVIEEGLAVYGMGSYHCITPIFSKKPAAREMIPRGLNIEHHAVPDQYVCFIYNHGGTLFKWFRNAFAGVEHLQAQEQGTSIYPMLLSEMPGDASSVIVLPHFAPTGTPAYLTETCGLIVGLHLNTARGDILKGVLEGITFYLRECVESLPPTGISIQEYRAVGGGSQSDAWIQLCADILGRPFTRPMVTEAGVLGSALIAGVGSNIFSDYREGVRSMVKEGQAFDPVPARQESYTARFEEYRGLYPLMKDYLAAMHRANHKGER